MLTSNIRSGRKGSFPSSGDGPATLSHRTLLPATERSPAELTLARHLARAVEDLLTVAPVGLALTETMGVLLCRPRAS